MKIERFEDLKCWQKAKLLSLTIYGLTNNTQFSKDFGLRDQIRRASVSVPSNIAEGFERNGTKEFIQFVSIAKGSLGELRTQLLIAHELGFAERADFETCNNLALEASKLCSGLLSYLKSTELKGSKYNLKDSEEEYMRITSTEL